MFFPERIRSIQPTDWVLDIGPGGTPHPRADVLLEYKFESPDLAKAQRGYAPVMQTRKPVVYYQGERFPFRDGEFDYVICSHVIEHVRDVGAFVAEITRVGRAGYLEYPRVYYDYLYNFPEHLSFVKARDGIIYWMNKDETPLALFRPVQGLFYESLRQQHFDLVNDLREFLFEGLEWSGSLRTVRTKRIEDLVLDRFQIPRKALARGRFGLARVRHLLRRFLPAR